MTRLPRLAQIVTVLAVAFPLRAWADEWLVLNPLQLELLAGYDGRRFESTGGEDLYDLFEGGFGILQTGYAIDPGLFRFNVGVDPLYRSIGTERADTSFEASDVVTDYDIWFDILPDSIVPLSARLGVFKDLNFNSLTLGSVSLSSLERNYADLKWKNVYFPTWFRYEERTFRERYESGLSDQRIARDDYTRSLRVSANSRKMRFSFESYDLDDRRPGQDRDFRNTRADWWHRFEWGTGSRLLSSVRYLDRTGFNANRQFRWRESARIRHGENTTSTTSLQYFSAERFSRSTTWSGDFNLSHSFNRNLLASFLADGWDTKSDDLDQGEWRTGLEARYRKSGFFGVDGLNVDARLGGYRGETDRNSKAGAIEVLDEGHVVPITGEVLLDRRFVIQGTVVVTDGDGNVEFDEGFDYVLLSLSEGFTQLQVIPGGRIETGHRILVSYLAEVQPSVAYSTTERTAALRLSWKGFYLAYQDHVVDRDLLSGTDSGFIYDIDDLFVQMGYQNSSDRADLRLSGEYRSTETERFRTSNTTFDQSLGWRFSDRLRVQVNLTESLSEMDGVESDLYQVRVAGQWSPVRGMTLEPLLSVWKRSSEEFANGGWSVRDVRYLTAGFRMQWNFRRLWVDFSIYRNERTIQRASETTDDRVMLKIRRRLL